jgi:hypothetical protein
MMVAIILILLWQLGHSRGAAPNVLLSNSAHKSLRIRRRFATRWLGPSVGESVSVVSSASVPLSTSFGDLEGVGTFAARWGEAEATTPW